MRFVSRSQNKRVPLANHEFESTGLGLAIVKQVVESHRGAVQLYQPENDGLQYTFDDVPVNVSLDWVPTVFLTGYISGAGLGYGSLAVRYVLD